MMASSEAPNERNAPTESARNILIYMESSETGRKSGTFSFGQYPSSQGGAPASPYSLLYKLEKIALSAQNPENFHNYNWFRVSGTVSGTRAGERNTDGTHSKLARGGLHAVTALTPSNLFFNGHHRSIP